MKTVTDIKNDILKSLGQPDNPVGVLLDSYLQKVITDIVRDQLIRFQIGLSDQKLITDYDWGFEDEANYFLSDNPIR